MATSARSQTAAHDRRPGVVSLDDLPLMLTVAEAAVVLRISRTSAYKLADLWRCSGGSEGLPVVRLGSRLLVRRADVAELVGLSH
jgi:excisionase family DNA binding protein